MRWRIAVILSLAIAISYFDRQTLPVAIAAIQKEIPISNTQFSQLQAVFLTAYAIMYAAGGRLIDRLGTRRGFMLIMLWWSLACALHGLAGTVLFLAVCRFLLGGGEGGGFPAATKAVAEWFPVRERSTALGLINAGTAVGAVAAPPLIALVISTLNWRWVFFLSGAAGLLWTLWWFREYRAPAADARTAVAQPAIPWLSLLGMRPVWGLVIAKFLGDAGWYFYLFWLPKYLYDVRGFNTKDVGYYAWIPYAAAGVGCVVGGGLSSWFIRRGRTVNFARKATIGYSVLLMPWVAFIPYVPVELAIIVFSVAFFGQQSWSTLMMTLPADLFSARTVGSVAGLEGFGGAMGGVVFGLVVGYMLDHGMGYPNVFAIVSTFHVLAFLVILMTIPVVKPVEGGLR